jgi:hypothetical protein
MSDRREHPSLRNSQVGLCGRWVMRKGHLQRSHLPGNRRRKNDVYGFSKVSWGVGWGISPSERLREPLRSEHERNFTHAGQSQKRVSRSLERGTMINWDAMGAVGEVVGAVRWASSSLLGSSCISSARILEHSGRMDSGVPR